MGVVRFCAHARAAREVRAEEEASVYQQTRETEHGWVSPQEEEEED